MDNIKSYIHERLPWILKNPVPRIVLITSVIYIVTVIVSYIHLDKIQFALQFPSFIGDMIGSIIRLELWPLIIALWGFFLLLAKTILLWLAKSLSGGVVRVFTIVPAKMFAKAVYKNFEKVNNWVNWLLARAKKGGHWLWREKFRQWPWYLQLYSFPAVALFLIVILIIGVLATGLRFVLIGKVGEMTVEKIVVAIITRIPLLGPKVLVPIQQKIHTLLMRLEEKSKEYRASLGIKQVGDHSQKTHQL